jgi:hypothetical protein
LSHLNQLAGSKEPVTSYQRPETRNQEPAPQISYYLYNTQTPVDDNHPVWQQPLPMSRHFAGEMDGFSISHGDYFLSLRRFLENADFDIISRALQVCLVKKVKPADIREIRVCLAKHGEFYHPARVEVYSGPQPVGFVLNAAISGTGIRSIHEEYRTLKRLNSEYGFAFIPRVYGYGEARMAGDRKIPMFLGDWLEGYHEFHIADDPTGPGRNICVWDGDQSRSLLLQDHQADIYRQAARILTCYYNAESFEQIFGWHHAAGDFIVRADDSGVDLKLITVRRYAPHLKTPGDHQNGGADAEMILQALLLFFLNLSIRMRLDRLDGVGDLVWADRFAVAATLEGFFEGLALKEQISSLPDSIDRCFAYFLSVCTAEDLGELCQSVADTFDRRAPETPIVRQNLKEHIASLSRAIEQFLHPS